MHLKLGISLGGALSVDKLNEETAPPLPKSMLLLNWNILSSLQPMPVVVETMDVNSIKNILTIIA